MIKAPRLSSSPCPPQDACYPAAAAALAACLLRLVLACPSLHAVPLALTLADNLLRHFASTHAAHPEPGGAHHQAAPVRGLLRRHSSTPALPSAVVIPVVPATHAESTVTHAAQLPPLPPGAVAAGGEASGAGAPRLPAEHAEPAVPETLHHAVVAAEGLPEYGLLGAARGAAHAKRPLLAAFACQRLRAGTMLVDKAAWQELVVQVGAAPAVLVIHADAATHAYGAILLQQGLLLVAVGCPYSLGLQPPSHCTAPQVLNVGTAADYDPDQPFELAAVSELPAAHGTVFSRYLVAVEHLGAVPHIYVRSTGPHCCSALPAGGRLACKCACRALCRRCGWR